MVTPSRGQLLLTTAVVLAVIVLGAAVILTATTTTDVRSPDDPTTDALEADRLLGDIERGLGGLIGAVNAERPDPLETNVTTAVEDYEGLLYEVVGDRRGTLLTMDEATIEHEGTLLEDDDLDEGLALPADGIGSDRNETAAFAGLRLGIDVESDLPESPEDGLQVRVFGEEEQVATAVYRHNDAVAIEQTTAPANESPTFDGVPASTCGEEGIVEVDLSRSGAHGGDCHRDPVGDLDPIDGDGFGLVVDNPDAVSGGYQLVVDRPAADYDDELATAVAWTVGVEVSTHARASEHTVAMTVDAYDYLHAVEALEVPW